MTDTSRQWLASGKKLTLGAFIPAGTMVQTSAHICDVNDGSVSLRIGEEIPESLSALLGEDVSVAVAEDGAIGQGVVVGKVVGLSGTVLQIQLHDGEDRADRRSGLRHDTEICYAWRSLGHLNDQGLDSSWQRECQRTKEELVSMEAKRVIGWRGRSAMSALPANLSVQGVRFLTIAPLPVDSYILIYLHLPITAQRFFPVIGKVVRSVKVDDMIPDELALDGFGSGLGGDLYKSALFFERISSEAQLMLGFYLASLARQAGEE